MMKEFDESWILWYDKKNNNVGIEDWDKFLIRISSFKKIENFCCLFGKIIPLSQLQNGSSYHIFKKGIEPRWEDEKNFDGGRWNLIVQKQNLNKVDELWYLTLTSLIGGSNFGKYKIYINGVVGTMKKGQIRIALWTKNSKNKDLQLQIGKTWKKLIQNSILLEKFVIEFFPHQNYSIKGVEN